VVERPRGDVEQIPRQEFEKSFKQWGSTITILLPYSKISRREHHVQDEVFRREREHYGEKKRKST